MHATTQEADRSNVRPIDLPEPVRSSYPMLRLFRYGSDAVLYDARSHFACVVGRDDLGALFGFLRGQSFDEVKASVGNGADDGLAGLWRQLERLRARGSLTPGPLAQVAELDPAAIARHVQYYDDNIVTRKFCLEVTQDCNFRCRYCVYTIETTGRVHAPVHMDFATATKAIDYYFDRYTRLYSRVPESKREQLLERAGPLLSWFGGEPLLRFDLVRDSRDYFEQKPWDPAQRRHIKYGLTTNFSIFSDEIADFLTSNRVLLSVSLDGPERENDKNRVFASGRGTFKAVYRNLEKLRARHPDYFKNYVLIQSVGAEGVDLSACASFFKCVGDPTTKRLGMGQYRPAAVVARGSLVGDAEAERARLRQSFDSEIRHFATHVSAVRDADALGAARSASPWFGEQLGRLKPFFRMPESPLPSSDVRHTMTSCAMGFDQLYVSADGGLHMCHLTDGTVRLGDVSRGLDRSLIAQRFLDSNSSRNNPGCRSCWIVNMCELCAAILSCEGGFRRPSPAECECFRLRVEQAMCNYLTLSDRPELLEAERRRIAAHVEGRVDITRL